MGEARPSRRAVLATGGALALSACLPGSDGPPPKPDPDLLLRLRAAEQVAALGAAYAAALAAHPGLSARLTPLAAEHRAHGDALRGSSASASGSPASSASGSGTGPGPTATLTVPTTPEATISWLTALEREHSHRRRAQSLRAGPALARLLASIGGCEAAHAALLERGGG